MLSKHLPKLLADTLQTLGPIHYYDTRMTYITFKMTMICSFILTCKHSSFITSTEFAALRKTFCEDASLHSRLQEQTSLLKPDL